MDPDRRNRLLVAILAVALVAVLAFAAGFVATESRTTVESTVVTAESANVTSPGDSVVLVVRGDGDFADRIEDRLEERLADEGYAVAVAQETTGQRGPLLAVDVTRSEISPGIISHEANLTVESYYATEWNETAFERYRETGVVERGASDGAVITGEHAIVDRTSGLSTRYRRHVADLVVGAVADGFRGTVPT